MDSDVFDSNSDDGTRTPVEPAEPAEPGPVSAPGRHRCAVCGFVFDEGAEQESFEDLSDDWQCPVCGAGKGTFEPV